MPNTQEQEKKMKRFVDEVKRIDSLISNGALDVEKYKDDYGKMLYLFFLKIFAIQDKNEQKEDKPMQEETQTFDATKADPFEPIVIKWDNAKDLNEKKMILEQVWDQILSNDDDKDAENKVLNESDLKNFDADWKKLSVRFEQKVYLLQFSKKVSGAMSKMEDFQNIDLVAEYNKTDEVLEDMMINKNGVCVIL